MNATKIKNEVTTLYNADVTGEDYTLRDKMLVHTINYNAQGKKMYEGWQDCDPDNETSLGCWGVRYDDESHCLMIRDGLSIGEFTFEQVAEDYRIENYNGEDAVWTKEYNSGYLVYEEHQECSGISMTAYEYEEDGKMILQKHASIDFENNSVSYGIVEYIYQDGKLSKEIWQSCESPSIDDFFNDNYTKNETDINSLYEYTESEELNGDKRVVTIRKYNSKDNTLVKKTIRTYDNMQDRLICQTDVHLTIEPCVEETIYQY